MINFKRLIYLGYYLKELDRKKFLRFTLCAVQQTGRSKWSLWRDAFASVVVYNISLMEYFQFHFYKLPPELRMTYAGTGFMYEFQRAMNPVEGRAILEDKIQFAGIFYDMLNRNLITKAQIMSGEAKPDEFIPNDTGKSVLKPSKGGSGKGIEIWANSELKKLSVLKEMDRSGNDMLEEFVVQHDELQKLSPSGLNTLRVVTQIDSNGNPILIAARLRISVNSVVDNLAAGNIVTALDPENGVVISAGYYSDITKEPVEKHPVTGIALRGFQVPHWEASRLMALDAARRVADSNKSVGWDIGITEKGPILIEGNHDWCKLVWQLPTQKGLKAVLQKYQ